jgi:hypothetical protein
VSFNRSRLDTAWGQEVELTLRCDDYLALTLPSSEYVQSLLKRTSEMRLKVSKISSLSRLNITLSVNTFQNKTGFNTHFAADS